MPVMNVGHMSVLMLDARMFVFVGMSNIGCVMHMKVFVFVDMLMHHRHMNMEMCMFFVCQQQRACDHQNRRDPKQ